MTHRVVLALAALTLVAGGCTVHVAEDGPALPEAAERVDGTEVWDLRERPADGDIGLEKKDAAVFESRPARDVLMRLPGDIELRLSARYVAFSDIGSEGDRLRSLDIKTGTMPLEEVVAGYRAILAQLDLPTAAATEFAQEASDGSGDGWVRSDRASRTLGDLELGVIARYRPSSGRGLVAITGGWPNR